MNDMEMMMRKLFIEHRFELPHIVDSINISRFRSSQYGIVTANRFDEKNAIDKGMN